VPSRRRAAPIRRAAWGATSLFVGALALAALDGCSKSSAVTDGEGRADTVVVYVARLVSEHPLHAEVARLSARIAAMTVPRELRLGDPLGQPVFGPPRSPVSGFARFGSWQSEADTALAQRVQEAEERLGLWPEPGLRKAQERLAREADDEVRDAQNEAELARMQAELRAIERHKEELAELRDRAASRDRAEAARAIERQAEVWRQIDTEVQTVQREAEARVEELRSAGESQMAEALQAARVRAEAARAAHRAELEHTGDDVRSRQPAAVAAANRQVEPAAGFGETPRPPDTRSLEALLQEIETAQRAARERRIAGLVATRGRLLREIAVSTRAAVQAVAIGNGIDVCFPPEAGAELRDATEDFRPLLREYWAARPAVAGTH